VLNTETILAVTKGYIYQLTSRIGEVVRHLSPFCGSIITVSFGGRGQAIGIEALKNESEAGIALPGLSLRLMPTL